jgi:hypothetical protein
MTTQLAGLSNASRICGGLLHGEQAELAQKQDFLTDFTK